MAKYVINRLDLGKCTVGYRLYVSETKEFIGVTEKQLKTTLAGGKRVYGVALDDAGNLVLDRDGFHTTNIMVETGAGNLNPQEASGLAVNFLYVVVGASKDKGATSYEVVNSRYGRTTASESKIKALLEICCIGGGVYLDGKYKKAMQPPKKPDN